MLCLWSSLVPPPGSARVAELLASAFRPPARSKLVQPSGRSYDGGGPTLVPPADPTPLSTIVHPNLIVALTPDLKTAKYLFGTSLTPREVDAALSIARGGHDWIGRWGAYALAALLLIAVLSAVYLMTLVGGP